MVSRSSRRYLQTTLFLGSILLILALGSARLFRAPTAAGESSHSPVVITEFMAADETVLTDEDGEYADWIELYNRSGRGINLLGWSLTDDPNQPNKWMLPNIDLPAAHYVVIFASGKNRPGSVNGPKEARPPLLSLPLSIHTNFKLAAEGGTLALYDNTSRRYLDAVTFRYPEQYDGMSYGACEASRRGCYLAQPTPGGPNDETVVWQGAVAPVTASVPHGFYKTPLTVVLMTETQGASIWYTLDGSEPAEGRGQAYSGPLTVSGTAVLRAVAVKDGYLAGRPVTFTYIFPEQVLRQPADPPAYPATWGTYRSGILGYTRGAPGPADYAMDPDIVQNPKYRDRMEESLFALPSVSLVTNIQDLDIYFVDPISGGIDSERPVSVEWLDPTGVAPGFQVDAGMRIHGHLGRSESVPKHSLRLLFKKPYGPAKLEYEVFPGSPVASFDTLVLRAGNNESYAGYPDSRNRLATYARDEWLRRSQLATSGFGARGRFVHLYLNGLYWGLYNLVERPDTSFAASYFGGNKGEWFSAKPSGADEGLLDRFTAMRRLAELGGMADPARYAAMQGYLDPVEFSDYLVLHWYAGVGDWPENNWYIAGQSESKFRFLAWDGELSWANGADVQLRGDGKLDFHFPNVVKSIFSALIVNPDFRMTLADRIYKLTGPGSPLSDAESKARWTEVAGEVEQAILAESARWGDAWFEEPINEDDWRQGSDSVLGQMTGNTARLLDQVRARGYYPLLDPPAFSQANANFTGQLSLAMIAGQGDIYFTTDGSDPRVQVTGAINPVALRYAGPIDLNTSTRVRARAHANGVWSALHEADFVNAEQPSGLRVTKLMYNPAGGDDYEFLELTNLGNFEVDLSGARFDGLDLRFPYPTRLAGGSSVMLVADAAAFRERYGNANIAAEYGGELADSGERITLRSASDQVLLSLSYDDENEWPLTPDGRGDLLVLENAAGDMNDPASWRANVAGDLTQAAGTGASQGVNDANVERGREPATLDPFAAQPSNVTDIRFGDDLLLAGYDAYLNGRPLAGEKLPALRPGDILEYVLYWQRGQFKGKYAYIKLLTPSQELVAQADRDVGLSLQPLDEGPSAALVPDRYTLTIPPGATVGVVQPVLYVWVPDASTRLPVLSNEGASLGQDYQLPALKIYPSRPVPAPQHLLRARFGDQIELLGYAVDSPEPAMRAGQPITVTLWFKTETPLDKGLVRSLQLHSAEHGMAAQDDSEPARRDNPTWAWQPGEVVVDEVRLEVRQGAPAGSYRLMLAMYDPADVRRLPVQDEAGNSVPDQILLLQDIVLVP